MSSRTAPDVDGTLIIGAVRTGLLRHSTAVSQDLASRLLEIVPGEQVRRSVRPMPYAMSPEVLTGVDCDLPTRAGIRMRGIGTFASRATITGGRVLQGLSYTTVVPAQHHYRLPWSHYLARPGVVEAVGRLGTDDVADGFAFDRSRVRGPQPARIADRLMGDVQESLLLDGRIPLVAPRTTLRWAVGPAPDAEVAPGRIRFVLVDEEVRTLRITVPEGALPAVPTFVEDLALHDWLLTVLQELVERARPGGDNMRMLIKFRPAIDHLLHLWMPGARVDQALMPLWEGLDKKPGFTRQWEALVNRIRDQLALATLARLGSATSRAEHHEYSSHSFPPRHPADPS